MSQLSHEALSELKDLKCKRATKKTAVSRVVRSLEHLRALDLTDLMQCPFDQIHLQASGAISDYEELQGKFEVLATDDLYQDQDLADDGQQYTNLSLLKGIQKLEFAYKSLIALRRLKNKLPFLEKAHSYSSPDVAAELKEFQDPYTDLDAVAIDIHDTSFQLLWEEVTRRFQPVHQKALENGVEASRVKGTTDTSVADSTKFTYPAKSKLKEIPLPTWSGDILEWRSFIQRFEEPVPETYFSNKRVYYLAESIKDTTAANLIRSALNRGVTYSEVRVILDEHCDLPRDAYLQAVKNLIKIDSTDLTVNSIENTIR